MIKKATIKDSRIVSKLALKLWPEHSEDELEKEFESIIASEKSAVFIYFNEINPIAFAQCQLRFDYVEGAKGFPIGYLEGIFVNVEYRRKGIAGLLLNECEKWSKLNYCMDFASDCEINNHDSFSFHIKQGFTEINRVICFVKSL